MEHIIPLFVAISLATAFLISLLGSKFKFFRTAFPVISSAALVILSVLSIFLVNNNGLMVYKMGGWIPPIGICMVLDGLSSFMLLTVNLVAFFIMIYSINYVKKYTDVYKYFGLLFLMLAGMNGVIITGDLFNLFVYLEVAAVSSYALVAFGTGRQELEASFKYMVMGTLASGLILLSIALMYSYTSTLNMADIGKSLANEGSSSVIIFISVMFIVGFGLKAALVPFHWWLPDAHPSAPAPISAMLSGVLIKALGVYAIIRIFYNVIGSNIYTSRILLVLGTLSMIVGVIFAIGQYDFKRLLAYHSISQIGYVILGIGLATPLGILGGLFHLFNHSIFKSLLFLNSGAVEYSTGTRDLKKMGGLNKKMPVTGNTSMIASMSIAGIPPFNGFWSKLLIIIACVEANEYIYGLFAVIGSVLTMASFMKVQKYAFLGKLKEKWKNIEEVPFGMKFSMICLALICVFGGLLLLPEISNLLLKEASNAVLIGKEYVNQVLGSV
ncbi:MAG: NADH/ubiquinone/plastoquinone (complex I) [Candidatus Mcinerneyibacterium aminivorans]|uniref:NADH/ubiquinone/plastoquinone (Complex I) n=1 Tax=Candidatus Mcinerneyibacterium aminivorans TaxID=2703815 RepID=A0A5D0MD91_9BACT|nr:MAG: NADH/ubiquinone/plastoquinone (complex I) [Candidatus Mcinerneyibacterium aminivorans]